MDKIESGERKALNDYYDEQDENKTCVDCDFFDYGIPCCKTDSFHDENEEACDDFKKKEEILSYEDQKAVSRMLYENRY